jgi:diketogulonate reductase-like aldo/keto reductase
VAEALRRLTEGEGAAVLPGAVSDTRELARLRARFLSVLPEARKHGVTQGFANHMCQAVRRQPQTAGFSPDCTPLDASFFEFAQLPRALSLVRALLGDDAVLHNAGISLVGDSTSVGIVPHQDQPLPTGSPLSWRGRVPPPSHPLALQILLPLDRIGYENGATFALPRTHARAERLDAWLANGTDLLDAAGLFPVRFLTAQPGDIVLLLGSVWHGASSHVRASERARASPRVALLYEYAPVFVEPVHRYPPALVERIVPEPERRLFPLVELARGGGGGGEAAAGSLAELAARCADGGVDVVSVWDWPREMRERPECVRQSTRVLLRDGRGAMPVFGLGTGSPEDEAAVIASALRSAYRLVDTAQLYGNQQVIADGLRASGARRDAIFLVSKAGTWCPGWHSTPRGTLARAVCLGDAAATRAAVRDSLAGLGTSYLDLFLLHWPMSSAAELDNQSDPYSGLQLDHPAHAVARVASWRELLALRKRGVLRAVGVSNFSQRQLEQLREATGALPDVLQIEMHPLLQRRALREYCERHGILVQVRVITSPPPALHLDRRRVHAPPPALVIREWGGVPAHHISRAQQPRWQPACADPVPRIRAPFYCARRRTAISTRRSGATQPCSSSPPARLSSAGSCASPWGLCRCAGLCSRAPRSSHARAD